MGFSLDCILQFFILGLILSWELLWFKRFAVASCHDKFALSFEFSFTFNKQQLKRTLRIASTVFGYNSFKLYTNFLSFYYNLIRPGKKLNRRNTAEMKNFAC